MYLAPNDPLDRLILQELNGNPVLFDQWPDAMDELENEPSCGEILQEKGLLAEDVLRDAKACRQAFHARSASWDFPVYDRLTLCRRLAKRARSEPSAELLGIFCDILCDPGFLLDHEERGETSDEREMMLSRADIVRSFHRRVGNAVRISKHSVRNLHYRSIDRQSTHRTELSLFLCGQAEPRHC